MAEKRFPEEESQMASLTNKGLLRLSQEVVKQPINSPDAHRPAMQETSRTLVAVNKQLPLLSPVKQV